MSGGAADVSLDDVVAAAARLVGRVARTPLRRSEWLSAASGCEVFLKLETLQPTFSFKIRGALNAVQRLVERGERRALVTASAGNHGRALAHAARDAELSLVVHAPEGAPASKLEAIRQLGADLRLHPDYDAAERAAHDAGASGDPVYISPYAHGDVIAGAGTVGLEILDERPAIDTIVVPVGGGGLISGIAIACKDQAEIVGVEVEASSPFSRSIAAGRIVTIDVGPTLADGLAGNLDPESITFEIVRRHVSRIVLAGEQGLMDAIRGLALHERLIAEGAAAAGVAAVVSGRAAQPGRQVAVVLSGANIDLPKLAAILAGDS